MREFAKNLLIVLALVIVTFAILLRVTPAKSQSLTEAAQPAPTIGAVIEQPSLHTLSAFEARQQFFQKVSLTIGLLAIGGIVLYCLVWAFRQPYDLEPFEVDLNRCNGKFHVPDDDAK